MRNKQEPTTHLYHPPSIHGGQCCLYMHPCPQHSKKSGASLLKLSLGRADCKLPAPSGSPPPLGTSLAPLLQDTARIRSLSAITQLGPAKPTLPRCADPSLLPLPSLPPPGDSRAIFSHSLRCQDLLKQPAHHSPPPSHLQVDFKADFALMKGGEIHLHPINCF